MKGPLRRKSDAAEGRTSAVKNRVLFVLVIGGALTAWGLAFLTVAPNRLVSGTAIPLAQISDPLRDVLLLPAAVLVLGVFLPQRGRTHVAVAVAATLLLFCLAWLAGAQAARLAETAIATSRTTLVAPSGCSRSLRGLPPSMPSSGFASAPWPRFLLRPFCCPSSPCSSPANSGNFPAPGIRDAQRRLLCCTLPARGNRRRCAAADAAHRHSARHALFRRAKSQVPVFAVLNVIQTVPSIALFGLLMVPLALVAGALRFAKPRDQRHRHGARGDALMLYSLLPVVRSTVAGLDQVPRPVVSRHRNGTDPRQVLASRAADRAPVFLPACASLPCRLWALRSSPR